MSVIEKFIPAAAARNRAVVLPEAADHRVLAAARALADRGICRPVLLGAPDTIAGAASQAGIGLGGIALRNPQGDGAIADFAGRLRARKPAMTQAEAETLAADPLHFGGLLVASGGADAMIAGAANETGRVISAGLRTVGLAPGIERLSSYFLMRVPDHMGQGPKSFIFADCAVNIEPDAGQLADIAIASAASAAKLLDEEPRLALLSFSTTGSAMHDKVETVTDALKIVRQRAPHLKVDGELQVDAALVPSVAARKVRHEAGVAGCANVLIFPDLNSGNIAYKLVQYMANAEAYGPFFQGFARPVCDLSRGCSVDDIIGATIVTLAVG